MIDPANLNWDDVRAFLAVARRGTVPEAARILGVSAATIGRRIQRLEAALGAALFDRLANRLVPTALGAELAEIGGAMERSASALAERAQQRLAPGVAPVRVTATGSISLFLAANAARLVDLVADDAIALSILPTKAALDIAGGEADIALRMRRLPADGPLAARRLGRIAFAVYAARTAAARLAASDHWQGMAVIGLTETARAPSQSSWLDAAASARGAAIRLRLADVALRHRAVRDGAGASLLPCFLGDTDPALTRLIDPPADLAEDVHLLLHERARTSRPVRAVADALAQLFRDNAALLAGDAPAVVDA